MKREVKFKAWYEGKMYEVFSYNLIANTVEIPLLRFPFIQEVIPDNIIEYTGLKDEDGKEMYEGDIYDIYESKDATDDYFCNIFKNMSDDKRKYANFINELITLYSGFNASFKREELDFDLTKLTFLLLDKKDIAINDIQDFCVRSKTDLSTAIVPQNGYLFEQPICILLSYYFFKHRNFLRNEWPLSLESLQDLYRAFNTSFDSF